MNIAPSLTWCPIPGYPGYEATPDGRVRSWWKPGGRGNLGIRWRRREPHALGGNDDGGRARRYTLRDDRGRWCSLSISTILDLTFGA